MEVPLYFLAFIEPLLLSTNIFEKKKEIKDFSLCLYIIGIIPVSYMQRHLGDKNLTMRHHYLGGSGTKPVALALRVRGFWFSVCK